MLAFRLLCLHLVGLTIDLATADKTYNFTIYRRGEATKCPQPIPTTGTIPTIPPIPVLPPGYVYHPGLQTAYKFSSDRLDWHAARGACSAEGARLAVIDTWEKLQYIQRVRPWLEHVWTGNYGQTQRDVSRDPWIFSPNLQEGKFSMPHYRRHQWTLTPPIGNCVAVSGVLDGVGFAPCEWRILYVCEIPDAV